MSIFSILNLCSGGCYSIPSNYPLHWPQIYPPEPEFLNITVSPSCEGAKFSWLCTIFLDLYVEAGKFLIIFIKKKLFIHVYQLCEHIKIFSGHFPAQSFQKVKFWRRKKSTFRMSALNSAQFYSTLWLNMTLTHLVLHN